MIRLPRPESQGIGIPREDIGAENTTHDIAKMGHVVDVWKCACDEDVLLSLPRKDLVGSGHNVQGTWSALGVCGALELKGIAWGRRRGHFLDTDF